MAALTADRTTQRYGTDAVPQKRDYPVAASTTIYAGSFVGIDTSGNALPATNTVTIKVVGRAVAQIDNSSGSAGDKTVEVEEGIFRWTNLSGDTLADADRGEVCFVGDDDQSVAKTPDSTNDDRPVAGIVHDVDDYGVWVETRLDQRGQLGLRFTTQTLTDDAVSAEATQTKAYAMGLLPPGSRVMVEVIVTEGFDAPAGATVLSIGDGTTATKYLSGLDIESTGRTNVLVQELSGGTLTATLDAGSGETLADLSQGALTVKAIGWVA